MKKKVWIILFICGLVAISFIRLKTTPVNFYVPKGWPKPAYNFSKNPLSEEGILLGRHLFYDPILSRDSTIACASCHLQATAFTHVDHDLSHGIDGKTGIRNSPTLINLAWNKNFMWDGGVNHLDVQPLAPITSKVEMDENLEHVVGKLGTSPKYKTLFRKAFADTAITGQKTFLAISQFLLQLNSFNSKYDKYIRKEKGGEFTEQEKNGLSLFRKNCASCHSEPLFTNNSFMNNGLALDMTLNDFGRYKISLNPADSLKFKVPTLRNIEFSYPYMHDGRFKKLYQVLNHYTSGVVKHKTLAIELQKPIVLTSNEKVDIVAFLLTLTDKAFLFNEKFSYPQDIFFNKTKE